MNFSSDGGALASARGPRPTPLVLEAQAVGFAGWIPQDTGWSLDGLAADHERLLEQIRETIAEVAALRERFADEDTAHADAIRQGFRDGVQVEAPELTPPGEREELIAAAERTNVLANEALDDFVRETAIPQIEAGARTWLGELGEVYEQARLKREEAARLLAEADGELQQTSQLEEWLKRNAGLHERGAFRLTATRFVGWDYIQENYSPHPAVDPDAAAVLVDTHDPQTFAQNLNRGVSRPAASADAERSDLEALEEAHGVEPDDPDRAQRRSEQIERVADEVDGRAWNPGNSEEPVDA